MKTFRPLLTFFGVLFPGEHPGGRGCIVRQPLRPVRPNPGVLCLYAAVDGPAHG